MSMTEVTTYIPRSERIKKKEEEKNSQRNNTQEVILEKTKSLVIRTKNVLSDRGLNVAKKEDNIVTVQQYKFKKIEPGDSRMKRRKEKSLLYKLNPVKKKN